MGGYKYRVFLRKRPGLQNGVRLQGVSVRRGSTVVNWKLWFAFFYPEQSVEFWQNLHISQASQAHVWCRKKIILKKITEANFSNLVSYLLYAY